MRWILLSETETITDKSSKSHYYVTGETMTGSITGHPYCISTWHVAYAADHHGGQLTENAIRECEKNKQRGCGVSGCRYSFDEHKKITSLLIFCKIPLCKTPKSKWHPEREATKELHQFLLGLKKKYGEKYENYAFVKPDGKTGAQEFP